jgi:hypothetical protein
MGYFLFKNLVLDEELIYSYTKNVIPYNSTTSFYNSKRLLSVVPFARYYYGDKSLRPYIHTGIGPGWRKTINKDSVSPESDQKSKILFYEVKGRICVHFDHEI